MNNNVATVNRIYEAFAKGEISTIIDCIAENVQWEHWADNSAQNAGVPWMQAQQGKAGVINYFNSVAELEVKDFRVLSIMANETKVVAEFVFEAHVPFTGNHYRDEEIHLWTFDEDGKVIGLRHYTDTAKHIEAAKKSD